MISIPVKVFKNGSKSDAEQIKSDKEYLKKLQYVLKNDLLNSVKAFTNERENLKNFINKSDYIHIDDQYLIKKCKEMLDNSSKLAKKISKYKEIKDVRCSSFKEMYNVYSLISEINNNISIMRSYNVQLTRYSKVD